jgi:hypothetical protein
MFKFGSAIYTSVLTKKKGPGMKITQKKIDRRKRLNILLSNQFRFFLMEFFFSALSS